VVVNPEKIPMTIITAIKPTGRPHLGNYVGAIAPTIALARDATAEVLVFVADGHALNSIRSPETLRRNSIDIVATYLACGLDPERVLLFRQSDVPELFEFSAILACICPKGAANRAHAYKAMVAKNLERNAEPDAEVNMGLYGYPVLMAADILAMGATTVPVGPDQLQHLETARELARRFNHLYGDVLVEPEASLAVANSLPGIDGRKMSKSYDNTLPLFAEAATLRARVSKIKTSSRPVGEPGDPSNNLVLSILRGVGDSGAVAHAQARLLAGAGDGELKQVLFDALRRCFAERRLRYEALVREPRRLDHVLTRGAQRARSRCDDLLSRAKRAAGLGAFGDAFAAGANA
jgi:tryptophanyl-tRNA synthetase